MAPYLHLSPTKTRRDFSPSRPFVVVVVIVKSGKVVVVVVGDVADFIVVVPWSSN